MGWKSVKQHYQIGHIVQVTEEGICIGSAYVYNLMVISTEGRLVKRRESSDRDLVRYQAEMDKDVEMLKRLVLQQDHFDKSVPVFTYDGSLIIEKKCEELGWPNITHDGELMYENMFSKEQSKVIAWAMRNAEAIRARSVEFIAEKKAELSKLQDRHDVAVDNKKLLAAMVNN